MLQELRDETEEFQPVAANNLHGAAEDIPLVAASASHTLVGPSTKELDSINELIKFDHEYYKVNPLDQSVDVKPDNSDTNSCRSSNVSVKESAIIVKVEPVVTDTLQASHAVTPASTSQDGQINSQNCAESSDITLPTELDILQDIDELFLLDLVQIAKDTKVPQEMNIGGSTSKKRKFTDSDAFSSSWEHDERSATLSDSGFSSDHDLASPYSDLSSPLGIDSWEDSFTELFPTLI